MLPNGADLSFPVLFNVSRGAARVVTLSVLTSLA